MSAQTFILKQIAVAWSPEPLSKVEQRILTADLLLGRKPDIPGVRVFLCNSPQEAEELRAILDSK